MAGFMWLGLGGTDYKTVCWHSDNSGASVVVECNGQSFGPAITGAALFNNVAIKVTGLSPDTEYPFLIKENGAVVYQSNGRRPSAEYPHLRTHPAIGTPWKVAWLSCMQGQPEWLATPGRLLYDTAIRVAIMVGDVPYTDDNAGTFNGVVCPDTIANPVAASWSAWYEMWHRNPKIQRCLRAVELVRSANDHEYYDSFDPSNAHYDALPEMVAAARAWQVGNPSNPDGNIDNGALYTRFTTGPIEHFLLDTQTYKGLNGTDSTLLGAAQLAWLLRRLSASQQYFKAIQSGYPWQHDDHTDSWAPRVTELSLINNHINSHGIATTFWPGGDYHASSVACTDGAGWRLNINPCPAGVTLTHGKANYYADCCYKIAGNSSDTTVVRQVYGVLEISADWQSLEWKIVVSNSNDILIDGKLSAGVNAWIDRTRTVMAK